MIDIFNTVESLYKRNYREENEEFKRGFERALALLEVGIYKSTRYNIGVENKTLKEDLKERDKTIRFLNKKLEVVQNKLSKKILVSGTPLDYFKEYEVESSVGKITLLTNMDKETFEFCCINFSTRYKYKVLDECKSKLLQYINSYKSKGFRAFKNRDVAIKEGAKINK